jgi:hypothetical protein
MMRPAVSAISSTFPTVASRTVAFASATRFPGDRRSPIACTVSLIAPRVASMSFTMASESGFSSPDSEVHVVSWPFVT